MMNRISNRLIARFVAIAALLALVMAAPAVFAQDSEIDYPENGTEPVGTFDATDADGDPIVFSLGGADAGDFEISADGALSFKSSPNFESPADADGDNVYMVTVNASGGSTTVAVTVTNEDEAGTVTLNDLQPQAGSGQSVSASVSDPDNPSIVGTTWQWSKSMDMTSWTDIGTATASTYTPQEEDAGYYLRATASYSDGLGSGRDSASAESLFPVEIRPAANFAPSFRLQDDNTATVAIEVGRKVRETAKIGDGVGTPVVATDADNDPLLYTLVDYDDPDQDDAAEVDDGQWFKIDPKSGQISVKSPSTQTGLTNILDQEAGTPRTSFEVSVTATDPSGAPATVKVTIEVDKVDEAPKIEGGDTPGSDVTIPASADPFNVNTLEEIQLDPAGAGGDDTLATSLAFFKATDPEGAVTDSTLQDSRIQWSLSGPDASRFEIIILPDTVADAGTPPTPQTDGVVQAALRWVPPAPYGPSFEAMDSADGDNVYLVTVTVTDGVARSSKAVTVTVDNKEEGGSISLTQRRPQEGMPITARLTDKDGNISGTEWQWYRGVADDNGTDGIQEDELPPTTGTGAAAAKCAPNADTPVRTDCWIDGATSATYIPTAVDATGGGADPFEDRQKLTVVAKYVDGFVTDRLGGTGTDPTTPAAAANPNGVDDGDVVIKTSEHAAEARPTSNTAPRFLNKGPEEREVAENVKGASVGDPVAGIDSDPLIHKLSGDDAAAFEIDNSGQIKTAKKLDHETKSSYTVTVTATDPSGASASIVVNITVTDADDAATVTLVGGNSIEYAENGTGPAATFEASDQDGDPVSFSLNGADAGDFEISADGALSFKSSPNFESPADADGDNVYMVTVNASGGSTTVAVTVTNEDEAGTVTLNDLQPQAGGGQSVSASVSDPDNPSIVGTTWQWSKSMDMTSWTDIGTATASTYTPQEEDAGYYLRATASYSDGLGSGRDSASAESLFPVEIRPAANFAPSFRLQDDNTATVAIEVGRKVRETAKIGDGVGTPVVATDADNDPLLYTLVDYDDPDQDDAAEVDDGQWFKIDPKSGQISVKSPSTQTDLTNILDQEAGTPRTSFEVSVTATDPSGAPATVKVTIEVDKVDEAPKIEGGDTPGSDVTIPASADPFNVNTLEEIQLDPAGAGGDDTLATSLAFFKATDPEGAVTDSTLQDSRIQWSLSGPDASRFEIIILPDTVADAGTPPTPQTDGVVQAALRWVPPAPYGPSFEAMDSADGDNVYLVTVTVTDGVARSSKAVTVTVDNKEEGGSISLTQRRPQEGMPITARLTDKDGNISGTEWQWYRGVADDNGTDGIQEDELPPTTGTGAAAAKCAPNADTPVRTDCWIDGATSATYIPTAVDATGGGADPFEDRQKLTVVAKYVDGFVTDRLGGTGTDPTTPAAAANPNGVDDGDVVIKTSEHAAEARPTSNTAPRFLNKGPEEREVAENVKGASVGDPVAGIDSDPLIHKLSGDDAAAFEIDNSGQIKTAKKLDHETKSSYTVTVTATDPSGASASIVVNITVTDADDAATVILLTGNAPAFAAEEMTRSVAENTAAGTAIGDPVAATDEDGDALTYTLWGDDAGSFGIDSATGQLMTSAALDYETKMSYTVTVTASSGKADEMDAMTTVTINVTDEGLDNAYDLNEDGTIERDEVIAAIQDYLAGNIERSEVTALIRLYFGNGG